MEIERKFLVDHHPELADAEPTKIDQGYLSLATGGAEVRLRRRGEALVLTVKSGAGRARDEEEIELDREQFDALWRLTEGRRLTKTRYVIPHGELEIELDVYAGELEGLMIAEVEFPDERTADAYEAPEWFAGEVTGKREYLNETLATEGRPG